MTGRPIRFWWMGISALLVCIGSVGPWARVLFITVNGLDGDGWVTLGAGLAALGLFVVYMRATTRPRPAWPLVLMVLAGATAGGTGAYDWANLEGAINDAESEESLFSSAVSVGWGLVLVTFAGFSLAAATVLAFIRRSIEPVAVTAAVVAPAPTISAPLIAQDAPSRPADPDPVAEEESS